MDPKDVKQPSVKVAMKLIPDPACVLNQKDYVTAHYTELNDFAGFFGRIGIKEVTWDIRTLPQ